MRRGRHAAALFGVGFVLLLFVGSAAVAGTSGPGRHSLHAGTDEVAAYLREAGATRVWVGEYLAVLAYLLFVAFAGVVWAALRPAPEWLGAAMRGAAWTFVALSLAASALLLPVHNRELEPLAAAALLDLRTALLGLAFVLFAGWLVAVGSAALHGRVLPRWLGWSAIGIGVLQLATTPFAAHADEVTGLPTFAGFVWVLATSVVLLRRGGAAPV